MSPLALSLRLLQAQPDERLLALAQAGHEPAFEALVRRYRRQLLSYCRRVKAADASAEDILQQALLQAWRGLAQGAEVRDPRAWLYRIVHNAAISAARGLGEPPGELSPAVFATDVEQVVEQRLAARDALAGIAALPALQREVMLETALEGRSHEEVAASLGLSSGSVRGLVYRARSTLRAAAAALLPGPLIEWAARQDPGSSRVVDAVAGGGTAGVAGVVLKGGAIVTAVGALAGTAVVVAHRGPHHPPATRAAAAPKAHDTSRLLAIAPGATAIGDRAVSSSAASVAAPVRLTVRDRHLQPSVDGRRSDGGPAHGPSLRRSDGQDPVGTSERRGAGSPEPQSTGSGDGRGDRAGSTTSGDTTTTETATDGSDGSAISGSTGPQGPYTAWSGDESHAGSGLSGATTASNGSTTGSE